MRIFILRGSYRAAPNSTVGRIKSRFWLVAPCLLTFAASETANAESRVAVPTTEVGLDIVSDGSERIERANLLPMLTQRVAAASCALTSGVQTDESYAALEQATQSFDAIIDALKNGNPDLNINGPETNRRTLHDLENLRTAWEATHGAIDAVLADGHDVDSAHLIDDQNLELLELSNILASDTSSQYSYPYEMTQTDVMMLNIIARQRTLSQQIAKDACEVWTGYRSDEAKEDLDKVMDIFEKSLLALRDGMPAAGLQPAPTPEIRNDLDGLIARWGPVNANLLRQVAGEELEHAAKEEIFHDMNLELKSLDVLVMHYQAHLERHH